MKTYLSTWKKFTEFTTCATRAEYWLFYGVNFAIIFALLVFSTVLYSETADSNAVSMMMTTFALILYVAAILPGLALSIRRLHDAGISAWYVLLGFIPVVNVISTIVFGALPSKK